MPHPCPHHCPGGGHDGLVAAAAMVAVCALAFGARVLIGEVLAIILACLVTLAAGGAVVLVLVLRGTRSPAPAPRRARAIPAPPLAIEAPKAALHRLPDEAAGLAPCLPAPRRPGR